MRDLLADANTALGGGPRLGGLTVGDLDLIAEDVNISFDGGVVTPFAQDYLASPNSQNPSVPEPSTCVLLVSGLLGLAATRRRWKRCSP